MSKPSNGISLLFNCPVCGNRKSTFYTKKDADYCKCTMCKTKYIYKDGKIIDYKEEK